MRDVTRLTDDQRVLTARDVRHNLPLPLPKGGVPKAGAQDPVQVRRRRERSGRGHGAVGSPPQKKGKVRP